MFPRLPRTQSEITELHGAAPVLSLGAVSFVDGENLCVPAVCQPDLLVLNIPQGVAQRKLYGGLWADQGVAGTWWVKLQILFKFGEQTLGVLPWFVGGSALGDTTATKSQPSALSYDLSSGGNGSVDTLTLILNNRSASRQDVNNHAEPLAAYLYPYYLTAPQISAIHVDFLDSHNIGAGGLRVYVACISTA